MGKTIGIRELKTRTSAMLRRAQRGEVITVTDRGRPIVQIVPVASDGPTEEDRLAAAVAAGRLSWTGGKPTGLARGVRFAASVADAVVEDRR
jgi:prevent-host-death family protein